MWARITNLVVDPLQVVCSRPLTARITVEYRFPEQTHWLRVVARDLDTMFRNVIVASQEREVRKDGSWGFSVSVEAPSSPCSWRLGMYVQYKTATMEWTEFRNEEAYRILELQVITETSRATTTLVLTTSTLRVVTVTTTRIETTAVSSNTDSSERREREPDSTQQTLIFGAAGTFGVLGVSLALRHYRARKRFPLKGQVPFSTTGIQLRPMDSEEKQHMPSAIEIEPFAEKEEEKSASSVERYDRYLKRLEVLKAEGKISERVYEKLKKEYETRAEE